MGRRRRARPTNEGSSHRVLSLLHRPAADRHPALPGAHATWTALIGQDDRMPESKTRTYTAAMTICSPVVRAWGRLKVVGLDCLPEDGPVLLAGNHDSYWDPVVIGVAAIKRRQIRALAKASMWKVNGLGRILDGMGQIPIERGQGDTAALDRAIQELRAGACIGIFPEGTRSLGRSLRARSGLGRLAEAVPETRIVCCSVVGATDIPRFPTRPHIQVRFFAPSAGGLVGDELAGAFTARLLAEIRAEAPIDAAGRRRSQSTEP
jgi:1-acyl-sn-glycerol-3-phosphate acyltransferase